MSRPDTPAGMPRSLPPSKTTVRVAPMGEVDEALLAWLIRALARELRTLRFVPARQFAPRDDWPRRGSGQVEADAVLDSLIDWHAAQGWAPGRDWLLVLTALDLGAPDRPYVFGQATVGGCCALVSLARLRAPEAEGAAGEAVLGARVLNEALHELGHVAGLGHCHRPECVMFPSPDVHTTDARPPVFCPDCAPGLPGQAARSG